MTPFALKHSPCPQTKKPDPLGPLRPAPSNSPLNRRRFLPRSGLADRLLVVLDHLGGQRAGGEAVGVDLAHRRHLGRLSEVLRRNTGN